MAENRNGVVATEGMLTKAARAGDLKFLTMCMSSQGERVTSAKPLCAAGEGGFPAAIRLLVWEMGADANDSKVDGDTPLMVAARGDNLAVVHCFVVELGAASTNAITIMKRP
jgi:ankyrin repeat protein